MHNWLIFQYRRIRVKPYIGNYGAVFGRTVRTGCG
jgi:hypothetical protein